jgi:hypothetical protein
MLALTALGKFLSRIPWEVWAFIFIAIVIWMFGNARYDRGYETAKAEAQLIIDKQKAEAQKEKDRLQAVMDAEALSLLEKMEKGYAERDKTISDLRSGNLRLRDKFKCKTTPSASATPRGDGEAGGGLSDEDAEFLVREASRADSVVRRLTSCQNILEEVIRSSSQ